MVVERTTRSRYNAGRVGGRAPRSTSKKGKQQEDSSESSEADTKAETSVARTQKTLKGAELKATEMFLQAREYLDSDQVTAIIHQYGANTRRELGLITRAQITDEILTGKGVIRLQYKCEHRLGTPSRRNSSGPRFFFARSRWPKYF